MVLAMAMDGYGYNPDDRKSGVPKEVSDAVSLKLGLSIDSDTTRHWLKEAANQFISRK